MAQNKNKFGKERGNSEGSLLWVPTFRRRLDGPKSVFFPNCHCLRFHLNTPIYLRFSGPLPKISYPFGDYFLMNEK